MRWWLLLTWGCCNVRKTRCWHARFLPELELRTLVALREHGLKASVVETLVRVPQLLVH